jgi:DNA-binding response OmpR family regulator
MASNQTQITQVPLVDDDDAVRGMMSEMLERKAFQVVAAASVTAALAHIATDNFDVLITGLHMPDAGDVPDAGDGFTVVSAMRHSQPNAVTMLVSGCPGVQSAMGAILLEADEIVVKPFDLGEFSALVRERGVYRQPAPRPERERVSAILQRCSTSVIASWLARAKQARQLNQLGLCDEKRTGHLPTLVEDLAARLRRSSATAKDSGATFSVAAFAQGKLRYHQGYTPAMLVHESRILQVTIFGTLKDHLNCLDFSLLLPDVMTIADEVDAQLTQSMDSYMDSYMEAMKSQAA